MSGTFAERPSGILVPAHALDKQHKTILQADFQRLKRNLAFAKQHQMRAMFFCETCNAPIRMTHEHQIVTEVTTDGKKTPAGGGDLVLNCGCTTWAVR